MSELTGGATPDPSNAATAMGPLQEILQNQTQNLSEMRKGIGLPDGRAMLAEDSEDPVEALTASLQKTAPGLSIEQILEAIGIADARSLEGIVAIHSFLNFLGYAPDKGLPKAESWPNILSDGRHIAHAAQCDILITDDRRLRKKAKAIYKFLKLPVEVLDFEVPERGPIGFSCNPPT